MDATQMVVVAVIVLAVLAFIVWPMVSSRRAPSTSAHGIDEQRIESRIGDYRAALRRNTVCESCLFANAEGARFCAECGARLPGAGAASV